MASLSGRVLPLSKYFSSISSQSLPPSIQLSLLQGLAYFGKLFFSTTSLLEMFTPPCTSSEIFGKVCLRYTYPSYWVVARRHMPAGNLYLATSATATWETLELLNLYLGIFTWKLRGSLTFLAGVRRRTFLIEWALLVLLPALCWQGTFWELREPLRGNLKTLPGSLRNLYLGIHNSPLSFKCPALRNSET